MTRYIIPSVGNSLKLERHCPHCGRFGGNIHSSISYRAVSDIKISSIPQRRMKCPWCNSTWTIHNEGVADGRQRTERLICIGVLLYMLGLSYRSVGLFLHALGCKGSRSSVERDVGRLGQRARTLHIKSQRMGVQILGVDGTGAKIAGRGREGMLFFVDIGTGRLLLVVRAKETDSRGVRQHVRRVMQLVGAKELRTDELSVYDNVLEDGSRTICLAHWLKSKCKRAYDLSRQLSSEGLLYESQTMLELKQLLHDKWSSPTVPEEIERLVRRFINCRRGTLWKVNQLLQHIERSWPYVGRVGPDPTNNATERAIGLTYKIRAKTMRGFKSWDKALVHPYLSEFLRGEGGVCDLRKVI